MGLKPTMINFDGQVLFKVLQGASLTIPDTVVSPSPTGRSSGVSPTDTFSAVKNTVGGQIVVGFSDIAGAGVTDLQEVLRPGDVVTVAAVASSAVIVSITTGGVTRSIATIPATAVAGVIGFYG
jgi:hypothetical protein